LKAKPRPPQPGFRVAASAGRAQPAGVRILVFNAGSSSLKFGVFNAAAETWLQSGQFDWAGGDRRQAQCTLSRPDAGERRFVVSVPDDRAAVAGALRLLAVREPVTLVGHRVVHAGGEFGVAARVDARVKAAVARFAEVAPLHNPPALAAMDAAEALLPGVPQVAVFDTAFFAGLPPRASLYPLPFEWHERFGVRRIGFHGISNAWCAARAVAMLGRGPAGLRLITCHLGGGCSATAVNNGAPVATTMGFSPLEGLMMGTRCGSVDPGLLVHLLRCGGLSVEELDAALNHRSGLLGVSGISPDFAHIEAAAAGNERARLAFDMFADRVRAAIGALAVTLGGVDALIFTDRVGEGSPALRAAVCAGLECLGVRPDPDRNRLARPDADVAAPDLPARILVIHTEEERWIAREAARVAGSTAA
jgi:acetate kinase